MRALRRIVRCNGRGISASITGFAKGRFAYYQVAHFSSALKRQAQRHKRIRVFDLGIVELNVLRIVDNQLPTLGGLH